MQHVLPRRGGGSLLKAGRLHRGDTVGIVCPAGPVREDLLASGIKTLESLGLKVKPGHHVRAELGYLAGSDRERAEDINRMLADPSVKGIFCARGGFGCTRILDLVDYGAAAQNPKVFVGYSDITALHLALAKNAGLVTFHGPMAAEMTEDFPRYNLDCLERALFCPEPLGEIKNPEGEDPPVTLFPGRAKGPIKGGNLSLLCSTIGTPYEIDTRGCIFFVEEIGEPPYKIDRMLTHLRMAGKFEQAAAIVFGRWKKCSDDKHPDTRVDHLLAEIAKAEQKPCISNVMIGHDKYNITIPLGCSGLVKNGRLYITEPGVL